MAATKGPGGILVTILFSCACVLMLTVPSHVLPTPFLAGLQLPVPAAAANAKPTSKGMHCIFVVI